MARAPFFAFGLGASFLFVAAGALAQMQGSPPPSAAPPPQASAPGPAQAWPPLPPAPPQGGATAAPAAPPPPGWPSAPNGWPSAPPPGYPSAPPGYPPGGTNEQWRYVASPAELHYEPGQPIPPGYHAETRARRGLVIAGPILFGVPYFFSLSVAASSKFDTDRWLYVPVIGPFIDLVARADQNCQRTTNFTGVGTTSTVETCADDSANRFFLMFDGLLQTAGTTMLILGLALPQHILVRDFAPVSSSAPAKTFNWAVGPRPFGRTGYGLGLDGTF